jgi:hypothetical protein
MICLRFGLCATVTVWRSQYLLISTSQYGHINFTFSCLTQINIYLYKR